jgi:hypothetical protein
MDGKWGNRRNEVFRSLAGHPPHIRRPVVYESTGGSRGFSSGKSHAVAPAQCLMINKAFNVCTFSPGGEGRGEGDRPFISDFFRTLNRRPANPKTLALFVLYKLPWPFKGHFHLPKNFVVHPALFHVPFLFRQFIFTKSSWNRSPDLYCT